MDLPPAWSQTCVCGRAFSLPQTYTFHQRSCQRTKKRLLCALEKAKHVLQARKRRKVESVLLLRSLATEAGPSSQPVDLVHPNNDPLVPAVPGHSEVRFPFHRVHHLLIPFLFQSATAIAKGYEDLDRSLAERRGRREHRQLPKRYRDVLPEPPAALPPASLLTGSHLTKMLGRHDPRQENCWAFAEKQGWLVLKTIVDHDDAGKCLKFYLIVRALIVWFRSTNTSSFTTWRRLSEVFSSPLPVYLVVSLFTDCERLIPINPC